MNQLEQNISESFRLAKNDIIQLQKTVTSLSQNQEKLMTWISDTREKEAKLYERVKDLSQKKTVEIAHAQHKAHKQFVASKSGSVVHEENCPFAKNIKPKSKVVFESKTKALNAGYKLCECLK